MAHRYTYAEFYVILSPVESVSFPIQRVPATNCILHIYCQFFARNRFTPQLHVTVVSTSGRYVYGGGLIASAILPIGNAFSEFAHFRDVRGPDLRKNLGG